MMRWACVWLFAMFTTVAACSSGGGDEPAEGSGGSTGGAPSGNGEVGSLQTECEAACMNQTGCPNDLPFTSCYDACVGFGEMFPACELTWTRLNHCMAGDDLQCDTQGYSATFNPDCLAFADQLGDCL